MSEASAAAAPWGQAVDPVAGDDPAHRGSVPSIDDGGTLRAHRTQPLHLQQSARPSPRILAAERIRSGDRARERRGIAQHQRRFRDSGPMEIRGLLLVRHVAPRQAFEYGLGEVDGPVRIAGEHPQERRVLAAVSTVGTLRDTFVRFGRPHQHGLRWGSAIEGQVFQQPRLERQEIFVGVAAPRRGAKGVERRLGGAARRQRQDGHMRECLRVRPGGRAPLARDRRPRRSCRCVANAKRRTGLCPRRTHYRWPLRFLPRVTAYDAIPVPFRGGTSHRPGGRCDAHPTFNEHPRKLIAL